MMMPMWFQNPFLTWTRGKNNLKRTNKKKKRSWKRISKMGKMLEVRSKLSKENKSMITMLINLLKLWPLQKKCWGTDPENKLLITRTADLTLKIMTNFLSGSPKTKKDTISSRIPSQKKSLGGKRRGFWLLTRECQWRLWRQESGRKREFRKSWRRLRKRLKESWTRRELVSTTNWSKSAKCTIKVNKTWKTKKNI